MCFYFQVVRYDFEAVGCTMKPLTENIKRNCEDIPKNLFVQLTGKNAE